MARTLPESRARRVEEAGASGVLLLLFVPAGILGIPVGHMIDRWPRNRVVQAGMATAAAGLWLVPVCRSVVALLAVGMVVMLGFLFGLPAWLALVADLAPEGRRGRMMGIMCRRHRARARFWGLSWGECCGT